jgi:hypothetical protein
MLFDMGVATLIYLAPKTTFRAVEDSLYCLETPWWLSTYKIETEIQVQSLGFRAPPGECFASKD